VLSLCVPSVVTADRHKSISDCTTFDQIDKGDTQVQLSIHNSCSIPVACQVTWRVTCQPDAKKHKTIHPGDAKVSGDASWQIDGIEWTCAEDNS
jgi:hypothetical protein